MTAGLPTCSVVDSKRVAARLRFIASKTSSSASPPIATAIAVINTPAPIANATVIFSSSVSSFCNQDAKRCRPPSYLKTSISTRIKGFTVRGGTKEKGFGFFWYKEWK
jgi:hypothetical protein